ncbi:MAG: leucine--tRNA ligase [Acidobacteria bacterium]|nr:leucine--tRNA ligase [Acidobacteriota bacterium]
MTDVYPFNEIESKWQKLWEKNDLYRSVDFAGEKYYVLEMLPYPSGKLHMGHVRNYSIGDALARYQRMKGYNVLHPIGWDAFGLPAENAAIKHGIHPEKWTLDNIAYMKSQMRRLGFSYDWERELATCLPDYYRWNQWFFIQMFQNDLVYKKTAMVNWCDACQTVLANEQVVDGGCWRDGTPVIQKKLSQWYIRITRYAAELLADLEGLTDWPERVRVAQTNWIGRSEGANVLFAVDGTGVEIEIFTTRLDTIYGANAVFLSPAHPLVEQLLENHPRRPELARQIERMTNQVMADRTYQGTTKEGIFLERYAINPFNGERLPIWIANFILMGYGTGAIMAVPAHDQRDHEFSRKYQLPIRPVIQPPPDHPTAADDTLIYTGYGRLINSGLWTGLDSATAMDRMAEHAAANGFGKATVSYRIRDWGISRQRYWGTPIPIVYCDHCGTVPVPEAELPVLLPPLRKIDYRGGSPLLNIEEFVHAECPRCRRPARRETDTMDTFVDSSWYYLRYTNARLSGNPVEPEIVRYWFPVDIYIGGIEHATGHLIYTRFWWKMMRDLGLVTGAEPVNRLLTQGMVIKDGAKMSKSLGNIVDPDAIMKDFGADTTRLFILFASPPEKDLDWSGTDIKGCFRFLNRLYRIVRRQRRWIAAPPGPIPGPDILDERQSVLLRKTHRTIDKVSRDIDERLQFNTAIAACMELLNEMYTFEQGGIRTAHDQWVFRMVTKRLLLLAAPFVPHLAEELWHVIGEPGSVLLAEWPTADPDLLVEDSPLVEIPVMINGKLRDRILLPVEAEQEQAVADAAEIPKIRKLLQEKRIVNSVYVPGRIINFIVK